MVVSFKHLTLLTHSKKCFNLFCSIKYQQQNLFNEYLTKIKINFGGFFSLYFIFFLELETVMKKLVLKKNQIIDIRGGTILPVVPLLIWVIPYSF